MTARTDYQEALTALATDRRMAHAILFEHRHPLPSAPFIGEMIDRWHSWKPQIEFEVFRHGTKSTTGEEAMTILASFQDFHNGVIIGSTEPRALERLEAIKHELETNERLIAMFGEQIGDVWAGRKCTTTLGVHLQALGVGQSVRGIKHHQFRPDFLWIDDIEDEESVITPEACKARLDWLYGTLLPICARHGTRVRITGNSLSSESVIARLSTDQAWEHFRVPVCYRDLETGEEKPSWPECFDMEWIETKREEYQRLGMADVWNREYMCETMMESRKPFKADQYHVVPRYRRHQAVQVVYDPARSQQKKSAATAKAAFSWIGSKLVVWSGFAKVGMLPDALIDDIFKTDDDYDPVQIAVEENGLEEWLNQPLRIEQTKRRHLLPHLESIRAPKDKDGFIRSLQPFFGAGDIEFVEDCPEFKAQIDNYPAGRNDALNVLAYALRMRPGQLIHDNFSEENIAHELYGIRGKKFLAVNCRDGLVTAVLAQFTGSLEILWDDIAEGDPMLVLGDVIARARFEAKGEMDVVLPPAEFDRYANHGLAAACQRSVIRPSSGKLPEKGRETLRDLLAKKNHGEQAFLVAEAAKWTVRALSGGYHMGVDRRGQPMGEAEDNVYRTLMEGFESFVGIMQHVSEPETEKMSRSHMSRTRDGRIYRSTIQGKHD